ASQDAHFVHAGADVRKDFRYGNAALAALHKTIGRREEIAERSAGDARNVTRDAGRHVLAVETLQERLGIPRIDLARPTPHEEKDDALRLRVFTQSQSTAFAFGCQQAVLPQQIGKREQTEPGAGARQHLAAGKERWAKGATRLIRGCLHWIHSSKITSSRPEHLEISVFSPRGPRVHRGAIILDRQIRSDSKSLDKNAPARWAMRPARRNVLPAPAPSRPAAVPVQVDRPSRSASPDRCRPTARRDAQKPRPAAR